MAILSIIILTTIRKTIDTRVISIGKTTFLDFSQSSKRLVRWSLCNEIQKERTVKSSHASNLDSRGGCKVLGRGGGVCVK